MKKMTVMLSVVLVAGALLASASAQEGQTAPAAAQADIAPAAAPIRKKTAKPKRVKIAEAKMPAPEAAPAAIIAEPSPATAAVPVVQEISQVEASTPAPAAVMEPVKPEAAAPSSCPHCFQPLLAGYTGIIADLKPWAEEMEVKAAALDRRLSAIQKQIDEKDDAIEAAKQGTDKKAMKAAVKSLNGERKLFLKQYSAASDEKDAFYKKFAKEAEKRTEGYKKIVEEKLQETLSAASQ